MSSERLLLVDDEDNLRSMLQAALRHYGFDVCRRRRGAAADVVLVDGTRADVVARPVAAIVEAADGTPAVRVAEPHGTDRLVR